MTKRRTVSISIEVDQAEARLARPKKAVVTTSIALRPTRSASGPNRNAPIIRPNSPAPNNGASCVWDTPHCARSAGAM